MHFFNLKCISSLAGLSLKSQELTALFLAVRLYCSFVMEYDIHTLLDTATLATTLWVIYMFRFKLRSSYMEDQDNFAIYYVVSPVSSSLWMLLIWSLFQTSSFTCLSAACLVVHIRCFGWSFVSFMWQVLVCLLWSSWALLLEKLIYNGPPPWYLGLYDSIFTKVEGAMIYLWLQRWLEFHGLL